MNITQMIYIVGSIKNLFVIQLNLSSKSIQSSPLSLQRIHNIHGSHSLPLGVLSVGNSISDHILKEYLQVQRYAWLHHDALNAWWRAWWFPGCYPSTPYGDAWLLPFQVLFLLCLFQSCCSRCCCVEVRTWTEELIYDSYIYSRLS